jgi:hypothetical protein
MCPGISVAGQENLPVREVRSHLALMRMLFC